ncbi:MAG: hypothetical protein SFX73_21785 [Kofleriaceae bacterium]|nr:hypothetical protein [Kofleriaceae bacterium]
MRAAILRTSSLLITFAACGGDGKTTPDARLLGDAPADARPCGATPQYGMPTPMNEIATRDADTMPESIYYESALNADPQYDALTIQLFKGYGAFEKGEIEPKLIPLNTVEAQFETCGACVVLYADYDDATGETLGGTYLASGGSLNLQGVSPNIKGLLLNTRLVEVMIDDDTGVSTPIGECATEISSFAFDFPVTTETTFVGGGKPRPRKLRR